MNKHIKYLGGITLTGIVLGTVLRVVAPAQESFFDKPTQVGKSHTTNHMPLIFERHGGLAKLFDNIDWDGDKKDDIYGVGNDGSIYVVHSSSLISPNAPTISGLTDSDGEEMNFDDSTFTWHRYR